LLPAIGHKPTGKGSNDRQRRRGPGITAMSKRLKWNAEEIFAYLTVEFPQAFDDPGKYVIEGITGTSITVRRRADVGHLRAARFPGQP
jgi:hypothetical protein